MAKHIFSSCFLKLLLLLFFMLSLIVSLCYSSRSFPISPAQAYRKKLQDTDFLPNSQDDNINSPNLHRENNRDDYDNSNNNHISNLVETTNEIHEPPVHITRNRHPYPHHHRQSDPPSASRIVQPNSLRIFGRYSVADEPHISRPVSNVSTFNEIRIPVFLPSISYENPSNNPPSLLRTSLPPSLPPPPPPPPYVSNGDYSPYFPSTPMIYPITGTTTTTTSTTPIPDSDPPGPIDFDDETGENSLNTKPADFERKPKKKRVVVRVKVANNDEDDQIEREINKREKEEKENYKDYHKIMSSPPYSTLSSNDERVKALSSDESSSSSCFINEITYASREKIEQTCRSHMDKIERLKNDCINQLKESVEFNRSRRQDRPSEHIVTNNSNNNKNNDNGSTTNGKGYWWRSLFFSKTPST